MEKLTTGSSVMLAYFACPVGGQNQKGGGQKKFTRASRALANFTLRVKFCPPPKKILCPRLYVVGYNKQGWEYDLS